MSEFILYHGTSEAEDRFIACDEFTQGYITAAFWLAKDWNDTDELTGNPNEFPEWTVADLSEDAWNNILADCKHFQEANAVDLTEAYAQTDYNEGRAGHDFWLTRNHHGVGFWDRDLGDVGDRLTEAAHQYHETDLYMGDSGKLYFE